MEQLVFEDWPDHGAPDNPQHFLLFLDTFTQTRLNMSGSGGPPVVHCSAGVGRSGTLIGLVRLLQAAQHRDQLSVSDVVADMRDSRNLMVS